MKSKNLHMVWLLAAVLVFHLRVTLSHIAALLIRYWGGHMYISH